MRHFADRGLDAGRRVAVVGAGIAGLSAAWLLSRRHEVVLYERNPWLGGHANTVDVPCPEGSVPVDTGFIVFNEPNYPNLTAMLDHLGVETAPADMSLGVSVDGGRLEYSSRPFGLFGQASNLLSPRFWRMIGDILSFYKAARELDHDSVDGTSLGQFLEQGGYSKALIDEHVLPMCAAIWSTSSAQIRDYPMRSFLRFFSSHGLLQLAGRSQWRTVSGGSRSYVEAMRRQMGTRVLMRGAAQRIDRTGGLVTIQDQSNGLDVFTDVVIAAHSDEALQLLADPSAHERRLLGAFRYTPNLAVLHDDPSLMPRRRSVWASWNYVHNTGDDADSPLCVSYWMNRLQSLETGRQLFVTLNPPPLPKPSSVIQSFQYTHPLFDEAALAAQQELWQLQGDRNTWFCGSYFGYGFHEDALQSGVAVATALGAPAPWDATLSRIATRPLHREPA